MKWCLSGRQTEEYIKKADEILVDWQDRNAIIDFIDWNPTARIIIRLPLNQEIFEQDFNWLSQEKILCKENFAVSVYEDKQAYECQKRNIKWFFSYPCRTFLQLQRARSMGASDVYITDELCHELDVIEEYYDELTIRVIANYIGWGVIPEDKWLNGICGPWFRPEDLWQLDQIDVCEFKTSISDLKKVSDNNINRQEQALFRIYAIQHKWDGYLNEIIFGLQPNIKNALIQDDFQIYRNNCSMKCMKYNRCTHCEIYLNLAKQDIYDKIKEKYN